MTGHAGGIVPCWELAVVLAEDLHVAARALRFDGNFFDGRTICASCVGDFEIRSARLGESLPVVGNGNLDVLLVSQFTCFTGTKSQILTQLEFVALRLCHHSRVARNRWRR